jgi:hypothetical protein
MEYVEFLRVRRSLLWHAGILAVIVLAIIALGQNTTVNINGTGGGTTHLTAGLQLPIGVLATIGGFFGAIYASSLGTSLNRESLTRDLSWTKPLSRTLLAVRYMLVDVAGVVIGFAIAIVAALAVIVHLQMVPVIDASTPVQLVLGAGIGVMWYALLQLLTCAFPPGARVLAGILWPVAIVLEGLGDLRGTLGAVVRGLNVLNPLAYLNDMIGAKPDQAETMIRQIPLEVRALTVWLLALLFCAIAVAVWPRKEA